MCGDRQDGVLWQLKSRFSSWLWPGEQQWLTTSRKGKIRLGLQQSPIAPSSGGPVHLLANLLEQQTCPDENSTVCHQTLEASTSSRSSLPRIMSKIRERSFWPYRNYRCGVLLEVALWRTTYACRVSFRSWAKFSRTGLRSRS